MRLAILRKGPSTSPRFASLRSAPVKSEKLPGVVDGLTPAGRMPTTDEMKRVVSLFHAPGG